VFLELPERGAIVAGAARGIGFAITERLSWARVVVTDVGRRRKRPSGRGAAT